MKNNIKVERARKNITQAQLADLVHVSRQTINAIELGKYNLSTTLALKIAAVFNCSIHDVFELEESDWESWKISDFRILTYGLLIFIFTSFRSLLRRDEVIEI